MSEAQRPSLSLDDFPIDATPKSKPDPKDVRDLSEKAGFPSREPKKTIDDGAANDGEIITRRRKSTKRMGRPRTPYTDQISTKARPDVKEIYQEIGAELGLYDHTVFEKAVRALLVEQGDEARLKRIDAAMKTGPRQM